jgi:transposase-like protein
MAGGPSIDVTGWLEEQLAQASPDLLRSIVQAFAEALMGAEADAVCGAGYGERSDQRTNTRNGYRRREWDTRAARWIWRSRSCGRAADLTVRPRVRFP